MQCKWGRISSIVWQLPLQNQPSLYQYRFATLIICKWGWLQGDLVRSEEESAQKTRKHSHFERTVRCRARHFSKKSSRRVSDCSDGKLWALWGLCVKVKPNWKEAGPLQTLPRSRQGFQMWTMGAIWTRIWVSSLNVMHWIVWLSTPALQVHACQISCIVE